MTLIMQIMRVMDNNILWHGISNQSLFAAFAHKTRSDHRQFQQHGWILPGSARRLRCIQSSGQIIFRSLVCRTSILQCACFPCVSGSVDTDIAAHSGWCSIRPWKRWVGKNYHCVQQGSADHIERDREEPISNFCRDGCENDEYSLQDSPQICGKIHYQANGITIG